MANDATTRLLSSSIKDLADKCTVPGNASFLETEVQRLKKFEGCTSLEDLTSAAKDIEGQLQELQILTAGQPTAVLAIINAKISQLRADLEVLSQLQAALPCHNEVKVPNSHEEVPAAPPVPLETPVVPDAFDLPNFASIKQYGWDQGNSFVTIYLTIDGLKEDKQVNCKFENVGFDFRCIGCNGKNYRLAVANLCEEVIPSGCTVTVKPNSAKIKLKKAKALEWSGLDDTEKKKQAQHKRLADSGASTQELLKNMYEQADDKTREELAKAAFEGQKKREAEARTSGLV